jgi:hypothetical protein
MPAARTVLVRQRTVAMYTLTKADTHAVGQPVPFRKAKRAQSATDDESWVEAQQANTLNGFDYRGARHACGGVNTHDRAPPLGNGM